jgi:hypothetical protein
MGNWDSVGYRNAQNTYSYKPRNGRWELIIWDANIVLGNGSDGPSNLPLFTTNDPTLSRWFSQGALRRRFLSAYHALVNGPMQASVVAPILDAKYAAFQEHGITAASPASIKTWITSARNYILSQINKDSAEFAVTSVEGTDSLILSGNGPLNMVGLEINGTALPVTWSSTKTWSASYVPPADSPVLTVRPLDRSGAPVGAALDVALIPSGALALTKSGDELLFEYASSREGTFELQAADTLVNPAWKMVAVQDSNLGKVTFRIPIPGALQQFYRVAQP